METLDALARICDQIPAQVKPLVKVALKSDAFLLRPTVVFTTSTGQQIEAHLEEGLRVPSEVVARLCLL